MAQKFLTPIDYGTAEMSSLNKVINVTSAVLIDSFPAVESRTVEYVIQFTQGSNYATTHLVMIHNGTDVAITEYGSLQIGSPIIYSFDAAFSVGDLELTITCPEANITDVVIKTSKVIFDT